MTITTNTLAKLADSININYDRQTESVEISSPACDCSVLSTFLKQHKTAPMHVDVERDN